MLTANLSFKKCPRCYTYKSIDEFILKFNGKIIKYEKELVYCLDCREKKKQTRLNNKEHYKKYSKNYQAKNYDKLKAANKIYLKNHKFDMQNYYVENIHNKMYNGAKLRAKHSGLEINITADYIKEIYPKNNKCPYLGIDLFPNFGKQNPGENSPTLDRIDNTKGYIFGNIEIISKKANSIKGDSTPEILDKIINFYKHLKIEQNDINTIKELYKDNLIYIEKYFKSKIQKKTKLFNINFDYFLSLLPIDKCCPIFKTEFNFTKNLKIKPKREHILSIDRIDNSLGYVFNNVVIVSCKANQIKNSATLNELEIISKRLKEILNYD